MTHSHYPNKARSEMLKNIIRFAFIGVLVLISVLSYLLLVNVEKSFPIQTNTSISFDFSKSPLSKLDLSQELTHFADSRGVLLYKTVAGKNDFYHQRDVFVFGGNFEESEKRIDWINFGLHGSLFSSSELGDNDLSGSFSMFGNETVVQALKEWAVAHGAEIKTTSLSWLSFLEFTLFSPSAWPIGVTAVGLTIVASLAWFALHARSRVLRIVNGQSNFRNWLEDALALCILYLSPAAILLLSSLVFLLIADRLGQIQTYLPVLSIMMGSLLALVIVSSATIGFFAWPSVKDIGSRAVPERRFRLLFEILKIVAIVILALTIPGNIAAINDASASAKNSSRWESLSSSAGLRIRATNEVFERRIAEVAEIARQADLAGSFGLTYGLDLSAQESTKNSDFDGLVLLNNYYLDLICGEESANELGCGYLTPVDAAVLPVNVGDFLRVSLPIWQRNASRSQANSIKLFRVRGEEGFPALMQTRGDMQIFRSPLLILVEDPGRTLNDSFLAASMTSTNGFFEIDWLNRYLPGMSASDLVLSVDSLSDAGLEAAQLQLQTAVYRTLALMLEFFGILLLVATCAWIYVCSFERRIFVKYVNGQSWTHIFANRIFYQILLALGFITIIGVIGPGQIALGIAIGVVLVLIEAIALNLMGKRAASNRVSRKG